MPAANIQLHMRHTLTGHTFQTEGSLPFAGYGVLIGDAAVCDRQLFRVCALRKWENIFGVFVILASSARFAFPEINGMDRQLFVLFGFSGHQKYLSELRVFADSAVFKLQMERVIRHAAGCETAPGEHAVQRTNGFRRDERLVAVEGSAGIRKAYSGAGGVACYGLERRGGEHCFNVGNADTGVLVRPFGPSQKNSANGKRDFFTI